MNKLTLNEKAVENLKEKGIDAKIENGVVYVTVGDSDLEISDFEIRFQANLYTENQPLTESMIDRMEKAAKHLFDNYGKKSYREKLKTEYNDEFGLSRFNEAFQKVQKVKKLAF
jgi:hypothetical protein